MSVEENANDGSMFNLFYMNNKSIFNKREPMRFKQFQRKGYSLFNCLGREVLIGTLSVATLGPVSAATFTTTPQKSDTTAQATWEFRLKDVEVKGSRTPLALQQAARVVTVLDKEQLAHAPIQSVNDLLKYALGVDVRQRGALGAQTDVGIREGTQEQIAVLLNGINICDPQTGHNSFDYPIDMNDIERIEVLEGPAGRAYGTSAMMGAINIITKRNSSNSVDLRTEGGSFGYWSLGGRGALRSGKFYHSVSGSYTRADGFNRSKAGHLNTDYKGGKAFYQGGYSKDGLLVDWHAGMSTKGFGSNTFYSTKSDEQFEQTTKFYTALQAETNIGGFRFRPAMYWNRNHDRFEFFRGSEQYVPYNYHRTDVYGLNLNGYFESILGRTAVGAEFRNEDLVSGNLGEPLQKPIDIHGTDRQYIKGLNRSNLSFFLDHSYEWRGLYVSAGLTAVKNTWNEMPFQIYPGVDVSCRLGKGWKIFASYNTSLRMPSVTELYYSVGGYKADKYLKPEELSALEGGLKYMSPDISFSANVFYNRITNMIDWLMDDSDAEKVWKSVNHTRVKTVGVQTTAEFNLAGLFASQRILRDFRVAYTYMNSDKNDKTGETTRSKLENLRHKLVASLHMQPVRNLDFDIFYRFQDRNGTYMSTADQVEDYAPYSVFDARLAWNRPSYSVYLEANNLFGADYVDFGNVPQPGLWVMAGVKWHLDW